jgi:hypothetical protein
MWPSPLAARHTTSPLRGDRVCAGRYRGGPNRGRCAYGGRLEPAANRSCIGSDTCGCRKPGRVVFAPRPPNYWTQMHHVLYRLLVVIVSSLVRSGRAKDLEIVVLRHQLTVLQRQIDRLALTGTDRTLLSAVAAATKMAMRTRPHPQIRSPR